MKWLITKESPVIIILMISLLSVQSCKKYLDVKPDKQLVIPSKVSDLQAILDDDYSINLFMNNGIGEESSDNYYLTYETWSSLFFESEKSVYIWADEIFHDRFPNDWLNLYNIAYQANLCLENLKKISKSPQNKAAWDNVQGSSYFLRAWAFHVLAIDFAKVYDSAKASNTLGIPLRLTTDYNIPSHRSSLEDTYKQIIEDLKLAIRFLPPHALSVMRPSKGAAYALLSRVFLSMGKYALAAAYADSSLSIDDKLLNYSALDTASGFPIPIFNDEIIFHAVGGNDPNYYAIVDSNLMATYAENDLRKKIYFKDNGNHTFGWKCSYGGSNYDLFVGLATDEMYLTKSECLIREGKVGPGIELLNQLLINRWRPGTFTPISITDQDTALKLVLSERRKELVWRDLRWMDIKRLNKEGANIRLKRLLRGQEYTLSPNDNKFALPLPNVVIQQTGMQQNPR